MSIMPWGLLWYDADDTLDDRVQRAIDRYVAKFACPPNTCFVHPADYGDGVTIDGIRVVSHPSVLRNHLWIGERDEL